MAQFCFNNDLQMEIRFINQLILEGLIRAMLQLTERNQLM